MPKRYTEKDVKILSKAVVARQICVPKDMSLELAGRLLNVKDWCGTQHGWVYNQKLGIVTCAEDKQRKHLVFHC
jgi:hypothetical protein